MKKIALIKGHALSAAVRRAMSGLLYSKDHPVHTEINMMRSGIKQLEEMMSMTRDPARRAAMEASRLKFQTRMDRAQQYADKLKATSSKVKTGLGTAAGVTAAGSLGAGGVYLAGKVDVPDMGAEYKLASDWVQGFITKCAGYGVDGGAWLNSALDEFEAHGMTKNSQWGKILGAILGGGALAAGGHAWRQAAVKNYQDTEAQMAKNDKLIAERKAEVAKWNQPMKPHATDAELIDEVVKTRNPGRVTAPAVTPAAAPAVAPVRKAVVPQLPEANVAPVAPLEAPPGLTLGGLKPKMKVPGFMSTAARRLA